jgi:hypothetical protein
LKLSTRGGWGETGEAGKKMGEAFAKTGQVSVEFVVTPETNQKGTILSFRSGKAKGFRVEQNGSTLLVYSGLGDSPVIWNDLMKNAKPYHLILLADGGNLELIVNGKSTGKKLFRIDLAGQRVDAFEIGDSSGGWHGVISGIAIYNTVLSPKDIAENSRLVAQRTVAIDKQPIILMGTLLESTEIPAPDSIGAYRRALVVNSYAVDTIVQGEYKQDRILVAEWAILDRKIVKQYAEITKSERLVLEIFDEHPELEGERLMMDIFEPDLDMYYRLNRSVDK